jgi:hypothetical protein
VILDSVSLTRKATLSGNALTIVGLEAANTSALNPSSSLSGLQSSRANPLN